MKLFTPGPVELPREVLEALAKPMISHRGEAFRKLYREIEEKLIKLFDIENGMVAILAGSGTTAVDAMAWSLVYAKEKVLVLTSGEFGYRLASTLRRRGAIVEELYIDPRKGIDIEVVLQKIESMRYDVVALVHNETSMSFVYRDLPILAKRCRDLGIRLLVDAVSSFCGEELSMKWGITAIATASHKALAAPPGTSFVALDSEAIELLKRRELNDIPLALDLKKYWEFDKRSETPFTPAIPILYAVNVAIDRVMRLGLTRYIEMHREKAYVLYRELSSRGLEPVVENERYRSNTVTAFLVDSIDARKLKQELEKKGFVVATGMGSYRDRMVRIGTMGAITVEDLEQLIKAIELSLAELKT